MQSQRVSIEVFPSDKFTFTFIIVIISIAFCRIYRRLLISDLGNPDCVCQTYLTGRAYPALYVVCWHPLTGVLIYPINWMCALNSNEFRITTDAPIADHYPSECSAGSNNNINEQNKDQTDEQQPKKNYCTEYRFQLNCYLRLGLCYLQSLRIRNQVREYWWWCG